MGNRPNMTASLERRVRRVAQRRGLSLLYAHKRNKLIDAHGGYMLRDDDTGTIVFGNKRYEYSATLEEVEAFLDESSEPHEQ